MKRGFALFAILSVPVRIRPLRLLLDFVSNNKMSNLT